MKVCVLLSGGLDSTTVLYEILTTHEVAACLSFNYGAKHNAAELACAAYHAKKCGLRHEIIDLPFIDRLFKSDLLISGGAVPEGHYAAANMKQTVVPFRNGIMLAIAAGFAESCDAEAVAIAAHRGDHAIYPDCREDFMTAFAAAIKYGTYAKLELLRPFIDCDKTAIVKRGAVLGVDFSQTWSCYKGAQVHCGKCGTCVERQEAFLLAGVPDPTKYAVLGGGE